MVKTPLSLLERLGEAPSAEDWAELAALYRPLLLFWLRPALPQAADVEDVMQDVMTVVVEKIAEFRHAGHDGAFRGWLRAIVVIKTRAFWRKQGRVPAATDPVCQMLAALEQDHSEEARRWDLEHDRFVLDALMARLQPEFERKSWTAFELYAMQGVPPGEVARQLGLSTNAVFIARSRILQRLREESRGLIELD